MTQRSLTEPQHDLLGALDDVAEHLEYEFDPDEWRGISTIGFAHISIQDGRCSFVSRMRSLANNDAVDSVTRDKQRQEYRVDIGRMKLALRSSGNGWRLSLINTPEYMDGPEHQRLDVRVRLHQLILGRLRTNSYLENASVISRMD